MESRTESHQVWNGIFGFPSNLAGFSSFKCATWGAGRPVEVLGLVIRAVFSIVQSVYPGPRTGLRKIHTVRPISGLDRVRLGHP